MQGAELRVQSEFEGMPEIPAHVWEEIDKGFHKYLFFETVKRGHRRYTCTACHKTFDEGELVLKDLMSAEDFALFHAKHNDEAECPLCGARATVKNVKVCDVTRFWASNCVAVFMANNHDDVWIRCVYADRGYCYNPKEQMISLTGKTSTFESNRYHLTPGSAVHWKAWGRDYPLRLANIPEEPFSWNHNMFMEKYHYSIVWATESGIEDTFLRYNGMDSGNCRYGYNYPVRYLCHYARHPQLEMLLKLGHNSAVWNVVMENSDNKQIMNWDAKTPWELFGLTRKEYNRWGAGPRYHRFDINILKIYKRMKGKGERDFEYAEELEKVFYNLQGAYGFIAKAKRMGAEIRELMRYIRRVQKNSGGACWHCIGITLEGAYTLWCDYINLAEGAGQGKSVSVMPKDLKAAHDKLLEAKKKRDAKQARQWARQQAKQRRMTEQERARQEIDDIKQASRKNAKTLRKKAEGFAASEKYPTFERIYKRLASKYTWGNERFTIYAPTSIADVIYDGMFLSHCVGKDWGTEPGWRRYLNRIRSGESFLLFLRHTDKQDEPYYILEVEPGGTVRQKRTVLDRQDDRDIDDIKAFIAEWQAAIQSKLTAKDKQAAQKSREIRVEEYAELRRNKVEVRNGFLRGKLLADVLEADLLEVGFATDETKNIKSREGRKKAV